MFKIQLDKENIKLMNYICEGKLNTKRKKKTLILEWVFILFFFLI